MSTSIKTFCFMFAVAICGIAVPAQDIELEIVLQKDNPTIARIKGKLREKNALQDRNWVFLKDYFGVSGLAKRVKRFELYSADGKRIEVKKFADGEFLADANAESFAYEIDLSVIGEENTKAHISWVEGDNGLIMLNDFLPQIGDSKTAAAINFSLPDDWRVSKSEKAAEDGRFLVTDLKNAAFLIGKEWRALSVGDKPDSFNFFLLGEWKFQDGEAIEMIESITAEYSKIFRIKPAERTSVFLMPFEKDTQKGLWRAETRGKNVMIVSSSMPFRNQALQRLHEQLRHELFHLWIPNRLNLRGNYAWFYEGFAVYQALKTGVWLGQIRLEDFLSTLGRAYDIHVRSSNDISFVSMATSMSGSVSSSVYSKGMLIAFLTDIAILEKTKGKRDISAIFRSMPFESAANKVVSNADQVILDEFSKRTELAEIVEKYIKGSGKIRWDNYLDRIGVEDVGKVPFARLRVKSKLKGREKALLKKLGYNRWRKFVKRSR